MRKLIVLASAGLLTVAVAAPAAAAPPASDPGCPPAPENNSDGTGWFLAAPIGDDVKFDRNGDGLICVKSVNGQGNSVTSVLGYNGATVKDNNRKK